MKSDTGSKLKHDISRFLKSLYKYLKILLINTYRVLLPLARHLAKNAIKIAKKFIKFVASIRVGIRPEFKEGLGSFKRNPLESIRQMINFRKYNRIYNQVKSSPILDIREDVIGGSVILRQKLRHLHINKKGKNKIINASALVLPVLFAILILRLVSPISAQLLGYEERLNSFLSSGNITAGLEPDGEKFDQVYYSFEDVKTVITDSKTAKGAVDTEGEYITWMESVNGYWQIFLYHIPTKTKTQLTYVGNNVNPKVSGGKVVWEGIRVDEDWQIYLFDGASLGPVTMGDASQRPEIAGDFIVYSRKDINNQLRSVIYSINDRKEIDISYGEENKYVRLSGKDIFIGPPESEKKFGLNAEDLAILNFGSLTHESGASLQSVQEEIDMLTSVSTSSGVLE